MTDYNGSTRLIKKMEELLATKKLSQSAAIRLLLETELQNIKDRHEMRGDIEALKLGIAKEIETLKLSTITEIELLKDKSLGVKISSHPKIALALFTLYSLIISNIPDPARIWIWENLKLIFGLA